MVKKMLQKWSPGLVPGGASKMLTKWPREKLVKKCFKNGHKMLPGEAREHFVTIFEAFFDKLFPGPFCEHF